MEADYDPITDDFLVVHHTEENLLVPPEATSGGTGGSGGKKHGKVRPKSAPKHRRPSPVNVADYPSNEEFSEEELRLAVDDDDSPVSDQELEQDKPRSESPVKKPAAEKVI